MGSARFFAQWVRMFAWITKQKAFHDTVLASLECRCTSTISWTLASPIADTSAGVTIALQPKRLKATSKCPVGIRI